MTRPSPDVAAREAETEDAYVWIDPARRSGEPCIGGSRIPVQMVIVTVWNRGLDVAFECWPDLTRAQVLVACWYAGAGFPVRLHNSRSEYQPRRGPWRKRWGVWAAEVHQALWSTTSADYDAIPDPPPLGGVS